MKRNILTVLVIISMVCIFVCFSSCAKQTPIDTAGESSKTTSETASTESQSNVGASSTTQSLHTQDNSENSTANPNASSGTTINAKPDTSSITTNNAKPDATSNNELSVPQKLLFFADNKETVCSSDMTAEVVSKLNTFINTDTLKAMKLAVSDDTISNIKTEQKCIELMYGTTQHIKISAPIGASSDYKFNKLLLVLNGDWSGLLFFAEDNTYLSGPIKISNENYTDDILAIIQN